MGFWRDIGSSLGACDQLTKDERDKEERDYAAKLTHHRYGCDCHWCKMAALGADRHRR